MTISNTSRTAGPFIGNGITKNFPFSYKVFARDDVLVAATVTSTGTETILVLDSDYTIQLNTNQNANPGGVISLTKALPIGSTLAATSNISIIQSLDLTNNGGFYPEVINTALDRIVITVQQLQARVGLGALNVGAAAQIANVLGFIGNLAASGGSTLIGFIQAAAGSAKRTLLDKLLEIEPSVDDFYFGNGDHTAAVKAAAVNGNFTFKWGRVYTLSNAEISIPSNRRITIEKGAVVNCTNVRFPSFDTSNVEWKIDGELNALQMGDAPAKNFLPHTADGTQNGDERGFLEFGSSSEVHITASNFKVHGSGKITGPWKGTPNFDDSVYQVNRKGIAAWNAKNVQFTGLEVIGFDGEAVYIRGTSTDCVNWDIDNINVHDTRFNGLNFNAKGPSRGLKIRNCRSVNTFQGIEMSVGAATDNYVENSVGGGIFFGVGDGTGPIEVSSNTVVRAGGPAYYLSFNPNNQVGKIDICDNWAIDCGQNSFILQGATNFTFKNNHSTGHGRVGAGYAFNIYKCSKGVYDGNVSLAPGAFSSGDRLLTDCSDVTVGIDLTASNSGLPPTYWYDEGFWVPTPHGLNVVGAVNYSGTYTRIGRVVHWQIYIHCNAGATTAATLVATTFTGLPFTAFQPSTCQAVTSDIASLPSGYVGGSTVFPPSWAATSGDVSITGTLQINPTIPL